MVLSSCHSTHGVNLLLRFRWKRSVCCLVLVRSSCSVNCSHTQRTACLNVRTCIPLVQKLRKESAGSSRSRSRSTSSRSPQTPATAQTPATFQICVDNAPLESEPFQNFQHPPTTHPEFLSVWSRRVLPHA